jgi:peptidoglycan hydrolase-like protein with peptidoglycan-binding domain
VKATQEALKQKGYNPGPVDGILGARTSDALREFQKAQGLVETGRLDAATRNKLGL